ncbi:hypothetical protein [Streptomyces sp. NBC_00063]|uniref:hypothetical protein n=1 Tax=Streptomyces sp. NBC_00063 TaxID=2975638 RepID=UPI003D742110
MPVSVEKTSGHAAQITWEPADDPRGYLTKAIESQQLAFALESLGASEAGHTEPTMSESYALNMAEATTQLAQLLERRAAVQVVQLRDHYSLSWRRIALHIFNDADKQSSVRRMYDSGRRHIGV